MTYRQRKWLHGLAAGFLGGFWSSIDNGLALMIIAPKSFNLDTELLKTLLAMFVLGCLSGGKIAAAYLKQSPLPPMDETELVTKSPDMKLMLLITILLLLTYLKLHS